MLLGLQRAKARLGQALSELEVVFARLLAGNLGIERFPSPSLHSLGNSKDSASRI